jgi:signal transduction histidine kinase/DNA-binding response OmpR family regulator
MHGEDVQGSVHPVLVADGFGKIMDCSDAAASFLELGRDVLLGLHLCDVVARLDEVVLDLVVKAMPSGRRVVLDGVCCHPQGANMPIELVACDTIRGPGEALKIVFVCRRPSEYRPEESVMVEARLARAERLEMAGTLAGQIAHDFNNLLTPLLAYPELIRRETSAHPVVGEYLGIMEKTAGDMSRLTQQLLALARRGQMGNDVFSINDVVEQVVKLMQAAVSRGIAIEFDLSENLLAVKGSRDQMRRVLENLCQNAVDAMSEAGTLRISTENVYLDAPVGQYGTVNIGEYVRITVSDTGSGIPDEIRDKIFDPFFTTKRPSRQRGSGLGLSIVHGIVRDHQGYIDLTSTVGKGSSFHVYIPIFRPAVQKTNGYNLPRGSERVLVVDDDEMQVQVLVSLLDVLGYKATGVQSGEEAIHRVRERGERYDLVIMDMVMDAGLDGLATFVELRKIAPDLRSVLISGFSKSARSIARAQQLGAGPYLRKPLTIERVAHAVRDQLDLKREAQVASLKPGGGGKRILIVDDEQMIRKLFGMIIASEFPDVVIEQAANGRDAVAAFGEGRHDIVVMDLQMPEADGREAFLGISRLCDGKGWRVPSVVFCTGFTPPESLNAIINSAGVHCLLRKPVKAETLLDAIRQRLKD